MSKVEHDFWTDEAKTSSTGVMKLLVDSARKNLLPNKDRMVFVENGKEAIKGVRRPLFQHARPLPDGQPYPRPMLDCRCCVACEVQR